MNNASLPVAEMRNIDNSDEPLQTYLRTDNMFSIIFKVVTEFRPTKAKDSSRTRIREREIRIVMFV